MSNEWDAHKPGQVYCSSFLITSAELQRILRLRVGGRIASSFSIIRNGLQYLVVARHSITGLGALGGDIEIMCDNQWRRFGARVVGQGTGDIDIAVLACDVELPRAPVVAIEHEGHILLGQEVRFAGFPLNLYGDLGPAFSRYPFPLLKTGIISALPKDRAAPFLLDANNVAGFSGSPVYFMAPDGLRICGVVSSYHHRSAPVIDDEGKKTGHFVQLNTGIVVAYRVSCAIDIIDAHGGGLPVPTR